MMGPGGIGRAVEGSRPRTVVVPLNPDAARYEREYDDLKAGTRQKRLVAITCSDVPIL